MERSKDSTDHKLVLYCGEKAYETTLPANLLAAFPPERSIPNHRQELTLRISIKKGQWIVMTANGSATNMISPLIVYGPSGDLILEESNGVIVTRNKKKKHKGKS